MFAEIIYMQTVIRDRETNEITHIHYWKNIYLTKEDHQYVTETEITDEMVEAYAHANQNYVIQLIANGKKSIEELKLQILGKNGFDYKAKFL